MRKKRWRAIQKMRDARIRKADLLDVLDEQRKAFEKSFIAARGQEEFAKMKEVADIANSALSEILTRFVFGSEKFEKPEGGVKA